MTILEAIILAIIEGITEYLPVSSTGHMILGTAIMGVQPDAFVKLFTVCIQLGAILSVVALYLKRFFRDVQFYIKLFVAFVPAVFAGLILGDYIDLLLENPLGVGISLLIGGVILIFVDNWFKQPKISDEESVNLFQAFKIGLFQCIALFPGVSRSGASIVGGMTQGLSRKAAAEFSFFLAVPTMLGATAKKLYDFSKEGNTLTQEHINLLVIGNIVAFVVAMLAIKSFIGFLSKHGFKWFGWYRIIVGAIIILLFLFNIPLSVV